MAKPASYGLFLGDLSLFCNEEDLRNAFQPYGNLVEVRIKRSKENKKNLSYGFVEYSSPIEAIKAMQVMDGKLLCGRALK
jgi:heterogeneous nuclear ribonucleoprotein A1/A3